MFKRIIHPKVRAMKLGAVGRFSPVHKKNSHLYTDHPFFSNIGDFPDLDQSPDASVCFSFFADQNHHNHNTINPAMMIAALYPVYGVLHCLAHPSLLTIFAARVLPLTIVISIAVYVAVFTILYPLKVLFYSFLHGPLGVISALFNSISYGKWLIGYVVTAYIMPPIQRKVYRQYWLQYYGQPPYNSPKVPWTPYATSQSIGIWILSLIPIVGVYLALLVSAPNKAKRALTMWHQMDPTMTKVEVSFGQLMAYGLVAQVLEFMPIVSCLFMFSNAVGGALWAADVYSVKQTVSTQPKPAATPPSFDDENFSRKRKPAPSL